MKDDTLNFPIGWARGLYTEISLDSFAGNQPFHEIMEWLKNHQSTGRFSYELCSIIFDNEEDAVMFALRWL